jgi:ribonuclease III
MKTRIETLSSIYQFKDESLLKLALTHRSAKTQIDHPRFSLQSDNEQLEFFGDALLNLIIAEELLTLFPSDREGVLSKKRAHVVDQQTLSQKGLDLKIDEVLILGAGEREQESHKKPRVLASAIEALIAAVYFDSDFNSAKKFTLELLKKDILELNSVSFDKDYKTQLQELTQQQKMGLPVYKELSSQGPSHDPLFTIALEINGTQTAQASGTSKKRAEQLAAEKAFHLLRSGTTGVNLTSKIKLNPKNKSTEAK